MKIFALLFKYQINYVIDKTFHVRDNAPKKMHVVGERTLSLQTICFSFSLLLKLIKKDSKFQSVMY